MITGIIVCILLGIIGLVYIGNIVDAYKSAQYIDKTNNYKSSKETLKEFYEKRFAYIIIIKHTITNLFFIFKA